MRSPSGATGRAGGSREGCRRARRRSRTARRLAAETVESSMSEANASPILTTASHHSGPVQPNAPHEARRPSERRDAQGAAVLAVVQAQHEARLRKGDVRHRRSPGEGAGAAEERLGEREERLVLGALDQGHPVQLQRHRIVRRGAALAGPASADPDAEHARVAVLCTGPSALQAKSRRAGHPTQRDRRPLGRRRATRVSGGAAESTRRPRPHRDRGDARARAPRREQPRTDRVVGRRALSGAQPEAAGRRSDDSPRASHPGGSIDRRSAARYLPAPT